MSSKQQSGAHRSAREPSWRAWMLSHGGYRGCLGPGCGPLAGAGYCLRTLACRLERLRPGRTTRVHRCDHAMRSRTRRRVNGVLARALWMRAHADRVVQPKALDPVRAQNCFLVALFQKASNLARGSLQKRAKPARNQEAIWCPLGRRSWRCCWTLAVGAIQPGQCGIPILLALL